MLMKGGNRMKKLFKRNEAVNNTVEAFGAVLGCSCLCTCKCGCGSRPDALSSVLSDEINDSGSSYYSNVMNS